MCSKQIIILAGVMPVDQTYVVYYGIPMNRLQLIGDCKAFCQTYREGLWY
jgi:hypothetical protein